MIDLTRNANSEHCVGKRIEHLVTDADKFTFEELRCKFIDIITDKTTSISKAKMITYKIAAEKIKDLFSMQRFLSNIYFKSAGNNFNL